MSPPTSPPSLTSRFTSRASSGGSRATIRRPVRILACGTLLAAAAGLAALAPSTPATAAPCAAAQFAAPDAFPSPGTPAAVAAADLTGDGRPDLAVANAAAGTVSVFATQPSGALAPAGTVTAGGTDPGSIAAADLDSDRDLDLLVTNQGSDNVATLLNDGAGHLSLHGTYGTPGQPVAVHAADLDRDGRQDAVVTALFSAVGTMTGDGAGGLAGFTSLWSPAGLPTDAVPADFDNDGHPDILATTVLDGMRVFTNRGDGTFFDNNVNVSADTPTKMAVGDFNHDGNQDVAGPNGADRVTVLFGNGHVYRFQPRFSAGTEHPLTGLGRGVATGDVNGDGNPDLIVPVGADDSINVLLGNADGSFRPAARFAAGDFPDDAALADFNGDGALDVAVAQANTNTVGLVRNTCPLGPVNLRATGIEVTQVIQDVTDSVPLVAGRRTFARLYVSGTSPVSGLGARLEGFDAAGRSLGPPLWPGNLNGLTDVPTQPDRGRLADSFFFELPPAWTAAGTITLRGQVNPAAVPVETTTGDNLANVAATFATAKALQVKLVGYAYHCGVCVPKDVAPDEADFAAVEAALRAQYPISKLNVTRAPTITDTTSSNQGVCIDCMVRNLQRLRNAADPGVIWFGVLGSDLPVGGIAGAIPGDTGLGEAWTAAHEIGHLLGRLHTLSTDSAPCNRSLTEAGPGPYPYPNGYIGGPADDPTRFYGLIAGQYPTLIPGPETGDLMSYCKHTWPSDFTYKALSAAIGQRFTGVDPVGDFLTVAGRIDREAGTATVDTISREPQVGDVPPLVAGDYRLRLLDVVGAPLASYGFTAVPGHTEGPDHATFDMFSQVVPFAAGTRTVTVELAGTGQVLASVRVSANAPTVSAATVATVPAGASLPATGTARVSWTASDPDGDPLTFRVFHSGDGGGTWTPLAVVSTPWADVDVSRLPASPVGVFGVVASDGVLTARAQTAPLAVPEKVPEVAILSPDPGSSYLHGQSVTLHTAGVDAEDGTLPPESLSWSSNLDGDLGTGALLSTATLSPGLHELTASGVDADGRLDLESVTVRILDRPGADVTPPTIGVPPEVTVAATGPTGAPVEYTVQVTDNLDPTPTVSCSPPSGSMFPLGVTTVTCTAADASGNTATGAFPVLVRYMFAGLFSPVDNLPLVNTVRAGSGIPVKFSVGGDFDLTVLDPGSPISRPVGCVNSSPVDEVEQTVNAGGSSLTYDPATGTYTYVWKTEKAWARTCRQFALTLADETVHVALFRFTK